MNRQQIRELSRKKLGETTAAFWSDAELNGWTNYGCRDVAFRTKCLRDNGYYSTSDCTQNTSGAKSNEISISATFPNLLAVDEFYFQVDGDDWQKLTPTTRTELDIMRKGWRNAIGRTYTDPGSGTVYYNYESFPGAPTHYYYDREEDILGVYPPCDTSNAGTNNARVYYRKTHADLSSDNETPLIPQAMHLAIVEFVVASGFESRGWQEKANNSWAKYFKMLNDYQIERHREKEDEEIIMKNYRNI